MARAVESPPRSAKRDVRIELVTSGRVIASQRGMVLAVRRVGGIRKVEESGRIRSGHVALRLRIARGVGRSDDRVRFVIELEVQSRGRRQEGCQDRAEGVAEQVAIRSSGRSQW